MALAEVLHFWHVHCTEVLEEQDGVWGCAFPASLLPCTHLLCIADKPCS